MKSEIIGGIRVTVIEDYSDMLQIVETCKSNQPIVPLTFNFKCNDRTITTTGGF